MGQLRGISLAENLSNMVSQEYAGRRAPNLAVWTAGKDFLKGAYQNCCLSGFSIERPRQFPWEDEMLAGAFRGHA